VSAVAKLKNSAVAFISRDGHTIPLEVSTIRMLPNADAIAQSRIPTTMTSILSIPLPIKACHTLLNGPEIPVSRVLIV